MSKRQVEVERRLEEKRRQDQARMALARAGKAQKRRQKAQAPPVPMDEIPVPKIRVSPTGRVNRRDAAAILLRDVHTLENWAARKIGPPYEIIGGRASYHLQTLLGWRGFEAR
jgi:hypothetical protein